MSHEVFISMLKLIHPSEYAALRISSSTTAVIGTTAPCITGRAQTVLRLLGKSAGSMEFKAVPRV